MKRTNAKKTRKNTWIINKLIRIKMTVFLLYKRKLYIKYKKIKIGVFPIRLC